MQYTTFHISMYNEACAILCEAALTDHQKVILTAA